MGSYTAINIPTNVWFEISNTLAGIDLENINPNDIAYLQGLVNGFNLPYKKEKSDDSSADV